MDDEEGEGSSGECVAAPGMSHGLILTDDAAVKSNTKLGGVLAPQSQWECLERLYSSEEGNDGEEAR